MKFKNCAKVEIAGMNYLNALLKKYRAEFGGEIYSLTALHKRWTANLGLKLRILISRLLILLLQRR